MRLPLIIPCTCLLLAVTACTNSTGPLDAQEPEENGENEEQHENRDDPEETGTLTIVTTTDGINHDGYRFLLNDVPVRTGSNQSLTLDTLATGSYTVRLPDVPFHCETLSASSGTVDIDPDQSASVSFEVSCESQFAASLLYTGYRNQVHGISPYGDNYQAVTGREHHFFSQIALSPDGTKIAVAGYEENLPTTPQDLFLVDLHDGSVVNLTDHPEESDVSPSWSPDGSRIVFRRSYEEGGTDLFVIHTDGTGLMNLTRNPGRWDDNPAWSPGGDRIAFSRRRDSAPVNDIYLVDPDGENLTPLTDDPDRNDLSPVWSPDGTSVAFTGYRNNRRDIYVSDLEGALVNLTESREHGGYRAAFSPGGERIAYVTPLSPEDPDRASAQIYVMNADGSHPELLTPTGESVHNGAPAWSPDGSRIAFSRSGHRFPPDVSHIYVMNADGSGVYNLNAGGAYEGCCPVWLEE